MVDDGCFNHPPKGDVSWLLVLPRHFRYEALMAKWVNRGERNGPGELREVWLGNAGNAIFSIPNFINFQP